MKTRHALGLAMLAAGALACGGDTPARDASSRVLPALAEQRTVATAPQLYMHKTSDPVCFFTEFGKYRTEDVVYSSTSPVIALGDIDGDGDLDAAIAYAGTNLEGYKTYLVFCENKIPR